MSGAEEFVSKEERVCLTASKATGLVVV